MIRSSISGSLATIALLAAGPAWAASFQDLGELDVAVAASMGAEIGQPGGARAPIDRRLKLKSCPTAATVSGPVMGAAVVRCDPVGWAIRVPLLLGASPSGSTTNTQSATAEPAVNRGQAVRLTVEGAGFTLSRTMIADANGKVGDMVSVRENRSAKPILAKVTGVGEVTVPGF
jgi:flagella basal body P-ring formation protein FlgA